MIRTAIALALLLATAPAAPAAAAGGLEALLNSQLTSQQQALLGCGEFYGTDCSVEGIDLLRGETSAILQSFPQPGTITPIAVRPGPGGLLIPLPGSRGPTTPDGDGLFNPFTGETFASDQAALSWNYLMSLVALSTPAQPGDGTLPTFGAFDPTLPFRPDGCSFARPSSCAAVQGIFEPDGPAAAIPEPGAALLFGLGFALVAARRRR